MDKQLKATRKHLGIVGVLVYDTAGQTNACSSAIFQGRVLTVYAKIYSSFIILHKRNTDLPLRGEKRPVSQINDSSWSLYWTTHLSHCAQTKYVPGRFLI